jgi:molybdate transport system substrate-binding protein
MRRLGSLLALMAVTSVCASCGGSGRSDGGDAHARLVVSAAASLRSPFTTYARTFKDADAKFSFAGSDVLAAQIRQGAKPDVFASANTKLPDELYREGLVERPIRFATNQLVLATRAGDKKVGQLSDLERKGVRVAIGSRSVPIGAYTDTVLARLPRAERASILANVRSREPDVSGIVGKLVQGAVDAGLLYVTDVRAAKGKLQSVPLDASLRPTVAYGVAVVKGSRRALAAKAFIYGLLSGTGRDALDGGGFGAPPAP